MRMLNDDSFPQPGALRELMRGGAEADSVGVICCRNVGDSSLDLGVLWRRGRSVHVATMATPADRVAWFEVDVVTFAGALVSAGVIRTVGVPRSDYFLMWEDYEYCLRIRRSGCRILLNPNALIDHIYAGSTSG